MEQTGFVCLGSRTVAQSIEPGRYLEFFDPQPLHAWSACLNDSDDSSLSLTDVQARLLCGLVYGRMIRDRNAGHGVSSVGLIDAAIAGVKQSLSIDSLAEMARLVLSKKELSLRDSIVYSSDISDPDRCLFAQESEVEALTQGMLRDLNAQVEGRWGQQVLACILLQFLMIHPFPDGNGRIARHLTVSLSAKRRLQAAAAITVGLQFWNRHWFNNLCIEARSAGLLHYLRSYALAFEEAGSRLMLTKTYAKLLCSDDARDARQLKEDKVVLSLLFAYEAMSVGDIREQFSCSLSKAIDVGKRVIDRYPFVYREGNGLSVATAATELRTSIFM